VSDESTAILQGFIERADPFNQMTNQPLNRPATVPRRRGRRFGQHDLIRGPSPAVLQVTSNVDYPRRS
jgi:hypothetical protein